MKKLIKFVRFIILANCFAILFSCGKKDQSPTKNSGTEDVQSITDSTHVNNGLLKTEVNESTKPLDTINQNNRIEFLTLYGAQNKETLVNIETKYGDILIKLFPDVPLHRASFIFLAKMKYFDYTAFHRVAPNFVVQAGLSELKKAIEIRNRYQNYTIPPEFRNNLKHRYGRVATARQYENNPSKKSNPFEFYIVTKKKGTHHLNNEHTIFGEVIRGMNVAEKISLLKTGSDEWPYEDVFLKVTLIE